MKFLAVLLSSALSWSLFANGIITVSAALADPPKLEETARIKQHRSGASGDLVEGEEHLVKAIFYWNSVGGALEYEISLDCHRNVEESDELVVVQKGKKDTISPSKTCGGRPCYVYPAAPVGITTVSVRVKTEDGWSEWSQPVKYLVDMSQIGNTPQIPHDEL